MSKCSDCRYRNRRYCEFLNQEIKNNLLSQICGVNPDNREKYVNLIPINREMKTGIKYNL